jgi:hypothetical protein
MRMILLTETDGEPILVNLDTVQFIRSDEEDSENSIIAFIGGNDNNFLEVDEPVDEIIEKMDSIDPEKLAKDFIRLDNSSMKQ